MALREVLDPDSTHMFLEIAGPKRPDQPDGKYMLFSTTGSPRTASQFDVARENFLKYGTAPEGFLALPAESGVAERREGYERLIGDPARRLAASPGVEKTLINPGSSPGMQTLQRVTEPFYQATARPLANLAFEGLVRPTAQAMSTPEGAMEQAGIAAGGAVGSRLGTAPGMLLSGVGAAGGRQLSSLLFGSEEDFSKSLVHGGVAAGIRGLMGGLQYITSSSMTQRVGEKAAKGLRELMESMYPHLKNDPDLALYAQSNPKFVQAAVQRAGTFLRESIDDIHNNFDTALRGLFPGTLKKADQRELSAAMKSLRREGVNALEEVNDPTKRSMALAQMDGARQTLMDMAQRIYPSDPAAQQAIVGELSRHGQDITQSLGGAHLLRAMERSGQQGGFSAKALGKEINDYFAARPGSGLRQAHEIVSQAGTKYTPSFSAGLGFMNLPKLSVTVPSVGMMHSKAPLNVTVPTALGTMSGTAAMESFTGGE